MAFSQKFSQLREADWLNAKSVRLYATMLLAIDLLPTFYRLLTGHGLIDRNGTPLGGDFISFYAASNLALAGQWADAWRPDLHHVAENAVFGKDLGYWAFFYPPPYLLVCLPLGLLPYLGSMLTAMATTSVVALTMLRCWIKRLMPKLKDVWLPLMAFPGFWLNIACGQNAALTTAIMAGGCLLLPVAPIASGFVFGLMIIKPQLAIAIPFVLAASGRWKTFFATGLSALVLCALSYLVVGAEGCAAFFRNSALARATLDHALVVMTSMQSLFGTLKMLGVPNALAYAAQAVLAVGALGRACFIAYRYRPDDLSLGALLISVTLLLSPFLLDYDLLLLVLPLSWLIIQGLKRGFRRWEKMLCIWIFVLPAVTRGLAEQLNLPLGAISIFVLFLLVQSRLTEKSL